MMQINQMGYCKISVGVLNQMEPWIGKEEKRAIIEYLDSGG